MAVGAAAVAATRIFFVRGDNFVQVFQEADETNQAEHSDADILQKIAAADITRHNTVYLLFVLIGHIVFVFLWTPIFYLLTVVKSNSFMAAD